MPRLSLIIITKNEEAAIGRCIRSLPFADEVIVVDSSSTDRTVEIARGMGAIVIETDTFPGQGPQKNRAIDVSTGDWIFSLDADEWIEPPLAEEVRAAIERHDDIDGYFIPRRSRFCGTIVRHSGWWPDYILRLFRRGAGRFTDHKIHMHVVVKGKTARLKNPIEHDSIADLADAAEKIESYAKGMSQELLAAGKKSSELKAVFHGLWAFFQTYVFRLGILDGRTGWMIAKYNCRYTYLKWKKVADGNKAGIGTEV
jgi:glycosyltransferase involved in cell wall biosynthesis